MKYSLQIKLYSVCANRAVEIPCPTCPTWSHFIQVKLEISILYILYFYSVFHIGLIILNLHVVLENSVDPDQLASEEAS